MTLVKANWQNISKKLVFTLGIGLGVAFILFTLSTKLTTALPTGFSKNQIIGSGLDSASGFEFAPDGRIFILERTGVVKIYKNGALLPSPFYNFNATATGDRGLIGIAFDPNFSSNHYAYFYYTGSDLHNYLVRVDAGGDTFQGTPKVLYRTNELSNLLHVGGSIRFGPDGKMYFAIGDNGFPPNAQDLSVPYGKIMRLNKDGTVPGDNPFVGQAGVLPEIWAYGFRNPWRFQFDSANGRIYGGDVGNDSIEEVNLITRGGNYGFPTHEGPCTANCSGFINPLYSYPHDGQSSAVTGGAVYRGSNFPVSYYGNYFFGDYARGFIRKMALNPDGTSAGVTDFDTQAGSVVDMKTAPDGSLYYVTYWPARLYQVTYSGTNQSPVAQASSNVTKGVEPLTVNFSSAGSYDPDGQALSYSWDFGDGTSSNLANPTKTYQNKGVYTAVLTVSDGTNSNQAVPIVIQAGLAPTVIIGAPADGSQFSAGEQITVNVFANDGAGFDINDSNIFTEVVFHHGSITHPNVAQFTGRSGTFTAPNTGVSAENIWYEIRTTATDTNGLTGTKSINIYPRKSTLILDSNIAGAQITIDGFPHSTPYSFLARVGFLWQVSAPSTFSVNGQSYQFSSWSDGGSQTHIISVPASNTTITANYTVSSGGGGSTASGDFEQLNYEGQPVGITFSGWGSNSTVFSISATAHGGQRSGRIDTSGYQNGDAKWNLVPVPVLPNQQYRYSVWYQSSLSTKLVAAIKLSDGSTVYQWLGTLDPSSTWTLVEREITMPTNATEATVYQYLEGNGWLLIDDIQLVSVTTPPPPPQATNLIPNGEMESLVSDNLPVGWTPAGWGSNSASYSVVLGNNSVRAIRVQISNYVSGDAKWLSPSVNVSGGDYSFSTSYRSSAPSKLEAEVTMADGSKQYIWFGELQPSGSWENLSYNFTLQSGAMSMVFRHSIAANGWLETDNYSLTGGQQPPSPSGQNLISNGGGEVADAFGQPVGWISGGWGNNSVLYSTVAGYQSSAGLRVQLTNYVNGDAKWLSPPCTVNGGYYLFSNWFRSSVSSKLVAEVTMADGSKQYIWLGELAASPNWTKYQKEIQIPSGAANVTFRQAIESNGWLETDNYSLIVKP